MVYGAAFEKDLSVIHIRADDKEERNRIKGVKYVQSNTSGIYPMVESDLKLGKMVLFTGTPCQISGLRDYLLNRKVDKNRLYLCDLICHGVPSPKVWKEYLLSIEEKYKRKIVKACFRDKQFGWSSHYESYLLEGKQKK